MEAPSCTLPLIRWGSRSEALTVLLDSFQREFGYESDAFKRFHR